MRVDVLASNICQALAWGTWLREYGSRIRAVRPRR
jgi:hypothetical protein